ncbi:MAG TPA: hemerythrin domain-containing protein [Rubrivivax sp.]|jgi:hemerythrin-like domain-containing protein|nr:hemerythrin domain-containing protein [Rubrivivax sp.]
MNYNRQVSQALDHEHRASLEHFERVERALVGSGPEAEWPALAAALVRQLENEIGRHFDFEEKELFPRMAESGDADMVGLLLEEHHSIRAVAEELLPLARARARGELPAGERADFKRLGLEMIERMVSHIQKESMSLLPTLEDLLDEDTDRELTFAYAAG